jgi:hypothetical protein
MILIHPRVLHAMALFVFEAPAGGAAMALSRREFTTCSMKSQLANWRKTVD